MPKLFWILAVVAFHAIEACPPGSRGGPGIQGIQGLQGVQGPPGPGNPLKSGTGSIGTPNLLWGGVFAVDLNANETIRCQTLNATGNVRAASLQSNGVITGKALTVSGRITSKSLVTDSLIINDGMATPGNANIQGNVNVGLTLTVDGATVLDANGTNSITTDSQGNLYVGGTTTHAGIAFFDYNSYPNHYSQTDGVGGWILKGGLQVGGYSTLSNVSVNHLHAAAFEMPTGAFTNAVLVSGTDSGDAAWTSLSPFWSDFSPNKPFGYNLGARNQPWGEIFGRNVHANDTIYAYNGYTSGFHYAMKAYGPIWTDNGAFKTDSAGGISASSLQTTGTLSVGSTTTTHNVVPQTDRAYGIGTEKNRYSTMFAVDGFFNNIHVNSSTGGGITTTSVVANSLQINTSPGTANIQGAVTLGTTLTVHGATTLDEGLISSGRVNIDDDESYIGPGTGALVVAGGMYVASPSYIDTLTTGALITSTVETNGGQDSTSATTGDIRVSGGVGVAKSVYVGTTLTASATVTSTLQVTGNFPQPGYVLTARDTNGNTQWQPPIAGCNTTSITSGPCLGGQKITCVDGHGKVTTGDVCPPAPLGTANATHWTITVPVNFGTPTTQPFNQPSGYSAYFNKVGNVVTMVLPEFIVYCNNLGSPTQSVATFPHLPSAFVPDASQFQYYFATSPANANDSPISKETECADDSVSMSCFVQFYPIGVASSLTNQIVWQRSDQHALQCSVSSSLITMTETTIVYYTN